MSALPEQRLDRVVGRSTARAMEQLGLRNVSDLLHHYPRRYYERGELTPLADLVEGEHVTLQGRVTRVSGRWVRSTLHKTDVVVTDGVGELTVTFFDRRGYRERTIQPGMEVLLAGTVTRFRRSLTLTNPELAPAADVEEFAGRLLPVYPASKALSSTKLARCLPVVLDTLGTLPDPLPADLRTRLGLLPLRAALELVHRPADRGDVARATRRLRFDEAFVLQVELARRRADAAALPALPRTARDGGLLAAFDARLPYPLTRGQREVGAEIAADLARPHPMHRLLQGEVGSGKTLVALRAMLAVVDGGGQAALLAPTEVLAQQHHRSVTALLGPLAEGGLLGGADTGTRVALLTGSQSGAARRTALTQAAGGEAGIVVGTHALLQERVQFADLGLVVVDEQHRFGVEQRAALAAKTAGDVRPHVLVMTATPIPRTVAMTVFGDLETSTLRELPAGRADVATHVVPIEEKPHYLTRAWQRIREEVAAGWQVFVVCPRIGGDEQEEPPDPDAPDVKDEPSAEGEPAARPSAVLDLVEELRAGPLAGLAVGVLHGRLPAEVKDDTVRRFVAGPAAPAGIGVLVATTVVEVGVDVPTASTMVVMDADRFGVSQLHQLRGRIGRGAVPGLCLLVTRAPAGSPARQRLDAVAATRDGFELARVDLEHRREGDVLGAEQSGRGSSLRLLSVLRHEEVIRTAREEAAALVAGDPDLSRHPELAAAVAELVDAERAEFLEKG